MRAGHRKAGEIREIRVTEGVQRHAEGSVLFEMGETKVVCAASVEERVPSFLKGTGRGWVTAEYALLPRSTNTRVAREGRAGKVQGRTYEIQRLIGRALRAVVDFERLGERTITIDCDVLQADGGTRTASINGAWIALRQACSRLAAGGSIPRNPVLEPVTAISVGIVDGRVLVDLDYAEDSAAQVDMNVVMTGSGKLIEVQGTAEGVPFSRDQLDELLLAAMRAGKRILQIQKAWMRGNAK
ncbi:MAG: ribonuclease PH [Deltaproteobacteria bacterium RBG_19FT_COMBO_60_16]|nr:MAG: ribonuclease PH [Deltaproteobacteria bacterium RBG_19FT_COMBO_60_16]